MDHRQPRRFVEKKPRRITQEPSLAIPARSLNVSTSKSSPSLQTSDGQVPHSSFPVSPDEEHQERLNEVLIEWLIRLEWRLDQLEAERKYRRLIKHTTVCPFENSAAPNGMDDIFYDWYFSTNPLQRHDSLDIPEIRIQGLNRRWFDELIDPKGLLECKHVDTVMKLFAFKSKIANGTWIQEWTIMDSSCWDDLGKPRHDVGYVEASMMPYVMGMRPSTCAMPWSEVDKIYGIARVEKEEWVLCEISLRYQEIIVYSFSCRHSGSQWNSLQAKFHNMAAHVPALLRSFRVRILGDESFSSQLNTVWPVVRGRGMPEINITADSAILALEMFWTFTNGGSIDDVNAASVIQYRYKHCTELFKSGRRDS